MAVEHPFNYSSDEKEAMISIVQGGHARFDLSPSSRAEEAETRFKWFLDIAAQAAYTQFEDRMDGTQFDLDLIKIVESIKTQTDNVFKELQKRY